VILVVRVAPGQAGQPQDEQDEPDCRQDGWNGLVQSGLPQVPVVKGIGALHAAGLTKEEEKPDKVCIL
jgi:hypothetical protein